MNRKWSIVLAYRFFSLLVHIHLFEINFSKKIRNVFKNSLDICGLYLNILLSPCVYFDNLLFLNSWLCFVYFFHCPAISEHVTSNASDSESSYRKCFKLFVLLLSPVIYPVGGFPLVIYSEKWKLGAYYFKVRESKVKFFIGKVMLYVQKLISKVFIKYKNSF